MSFRTWCLPLAILSALLITAAPRPATAADQLIAKVSGQVNHVIADDTNVYWTQVDKKGVKVRKIAKTGGPITTLASEPLKDKKGFRVSYIQLQQVGDTLYWTRQRTGFLRHWSIWSVPKAGGDVTTIVPEDVMIDPAFTDAWRVGGQYIAIAVAGTEKAARKLEVAVGTQVAVYDTVGGTWTALLDDRFQPGGFCILAADTNYVFVRGATQDNHTEVGRISPAAGPASYQVLDDHSGVDRDLFQPGVGNGTSIFYWSHLPSQDRQLVSLSVNGGNPHTLMTGHFGVGLTADSDNLFWDEIGNSHLDCIPNSGGLSTPVVLSRNLFRTSSIGGFGIDLGNLYVTKKQGGGKFGIYAVSK